ncbi:hypothetical protein GGI15_002162 [Coemansia interrupta]|uniref:BZIP domain-containing protein n=1 Tax=Coemansia interrupta TaxID=1126814 RepID=A0A9W8HM50_9FUNG|nr:hypothetical protein GGI15_002162 [Coemansia interrupta]
MAYSPHSNQQQSTSSTQPQQQAQTIPWDIFSAISSVPSTGQQPWTPISQQPTQHHYQTEQSPVVINGMPLVPMVQMPPVQQQTKPRSISIEASGTSGSGNVGGLAKMPLLAAAPSSSQFHRPVIMPKGGVAALSEASAAPAPTPNTSQQRTSAKAKRASADVTADLALDDDVESAAFAEGQVEDGDADNRVRAAEEDKRRRNTAASARFRIKKKMKEQALERTAREMTAKAEALEKRVHELETETRWLKSLITEKDPSVLSNVHCPCHHPNGLDVSSSSDASQQQPAFKRPRI